MKTRRIFPFAFCLLMLFIFPYKTFAGFPIGKYRNLVVPSFSYYSQTDHFDVHGNYVKGAPGARFSSFSANLYVGYGISRRLDVIISVPYLYQVNNLGQGNSIISQGAGDMVAGLSYNLINFKYVRFLSVQVSGIIPLYTVPANGNSALGLGNSGTEIKLMYCGNLPGFIADKGYFNTEVAYRRYFDVQGPDQLSFLATVGIPISWHNQVSLDVSVFRSFSSNTTFNINYNAERNYAFCETTAQFRPPVFTPVFDVPRRLLCSLRDKYRFGLWRFGSNHF
ncbi:hypothetical protein [uncultured Mucilaginibacter sp.]|uniref:hypothetical protein n=1 Tax=uncultured Mucilaginibacter sp. TaxID=797541 RepID=UPI0025EBB563|nr:hypothetical protein [uncultured Mucilaginibacter sp.]